MQKEQLSFLIGCRGIIPGYAPTTSQIARELDIKYGKINRINP